MKLLKWPVLAVATMLAFASCSDNDNDAPAPPSEKEGALISLDNPAIVYDQDGVWQDLLNPDAPAPVFDEFVFSHTVTDWGGVYSWDGFCPSKSTDKTQYADSWPSHQWTSVTGGAVDGPGKPYLVAYWNSMEDAAAPSCSIKNQDGDAFRPVSVCLTLTTWSYFDMKEGGTFCKKFEEGDWCKIHICGVVADKTVAQIEVTVADGTDILDSWKKIDLTPLGLVDYVYFTMSSTDNSYGFMNNASYFCLDQLRVD